MEALRSFFTENISLKVVAVLLSVLLWAYVRGQEVGTEQYVVPIEAVNVPGHILTPVKVSRIPASSLEANNQRLGRVVIRGPRTHLETTDLSGIVKIQIDLSKVNFPEGSNSFSLATDNVYIPVALAETLDLEVVNVEPEEVQVEIQFITWTVNVETPEFELSEGMSVKNVRVEPDTFTVAGPIPGNPETLTPSAIALTNRDESGSFTVKGVEAPLGNPRVRLVLEEDGARRVSPNLQPTVTVSGELVEAGE